MLDKTEQDVPSATARVAGLKSEGGATPATMDEFLTSVFGRVARYWKRTLASNYPEVSAKSAWPRVGQRVTTLCMNLDRSPVVADDSRHLCRLERPHGCEDSATSHL